MLTLALWLATIAFRVGFELAERFAFSLGVRPGAIWPSLAVTIGMQAIVTRYPAIGGHLGPAELRV